MKPSHTICDIMTYFCVSSINSVCVCMCNSFHTHPKCETCNCKEIRKTYSFFSSICHQQTYLPFVCVRLCMNVTRVSFCHIYYKIKDEMIGFSTSKWKRFRNNSNVKRNFIFLWNLLLLQTLLRPFFKENIL